jgi:hypothetical protein
MGSTYWYARAQFDATPSGPYYERKETAARHTDTESGERLRPIDESVLPDDAEIIRPKDAADADETDDESDVVPITEVPLDELDSHDALKARAEAEGIAEETDLRSKSSIRAALEEHAESVGDDEQQEGE